MADTSDKHGKPFYVLYPRWTVHLSGVNQREIDNLNRLWNDPINDKNTLTPGMMQTLLGKGTEKDFGASPIVCFPYFENLEDHGRKTYSSETSTNTINTGNNCDFIYNQDCRVGNSLSFQDVSNAYKNLYGFTLDEVYFFDEVIKNNPEVFAWWLLLSWFMIPIDFSMVSGTQRKICTTYLTTCGEGYHCFCLKEKIMRISASVLELLSMKHF